MEVTRTKPQKDWVNIAFLTLTPVLGIPGTILYTWRYGFELWMPLLFVLMYALVGMSICAGYHRYFSHKSYEVSPAIQVFYAIFGAMAAQNSILWWSAGHRMHHKYVDRDWDPYNINRGFLWAHILWIFYKNPEKDDTFANCGDLLKNRVVMWQHRWHKVILIVAGFGLPTLIGAMFGHPMAGLLWGGFLRIATIHHTTFFVNSLAHYWGERTYSDEQTARDNWAVAFVSLGEGFHSFHHRFPADFRNGIRWYHWDPAKWFIGVLRYAGLARDLRQTSMPMIEQARMQAAVKRLADQIERAPGGYGEEIRARINAARESLEYAFALWRQHAEERAAGVSSRWRETRRQAKRKVREARREWRAAIRMVSSQPQRA